MEENRSGYRILVADDDPNVHQSLNAYFRREGYQMISAYDGNQAVEQVHRMRPDIAILDIMMPGMDGLMVCREIRKESNMPIIMLTAKGEEFDKLLGLEMGADDYITKPFDPAEVLARVRSHLRRYTRLGAQPAAERGNVYTVGPIRLDDEAKCVTLDGEPVSLTPMEYNILRLLIRHPGHIYSSSQIYELIWHEKPVGAENAVSVHIRHLRQKLEIDPSQPRWLKVVWGLGYKMEGGRQA
jgi:DNA-binding response OmpR family regulator